MIGRFWNVPRLLHAILVSKELSKMFYVSRFVGSENLWIVSKLKDLWITCDTRPYQYVRARLPYLQLISKRSRLSMVPECIYINWMNERRSLIDYRASCLITCEVWLVTDFRIHPQCHLSVLRDGKCMYVNKIGTLHTRGWLCRDRRLEICCPTRREILPFQGPQFLHICYLLDTGLKDWYRRWEVLYWH